jgi:hypothetical protein
LPPIAGPRGWLLPVGPGHHRGRASARDLDRHELDHRPDRHSLPVRGWIRAGALVDLFTPAAGPMRPGLARPTAIYASTGDSGEGARAGETVNPLAARLGIQVSTSFTKADETALARQVAARITPTLICWEHGGIPDITRAFRPLAPAPSDSWPGDRFDMVWMLTPAATGWAFAEMPQLLLAGDSAQRL